MLLTIKLLCYVRPVGEKQFMTMSRKKPTIKLIKTMNLVVFGVIPKSVAGMVNSSTGLLDVSAWKTIFRAKALWFTGFDSPFLAPEMPA